MVKQYNRICNWCEGGFITENCRYKLCDKCRAKNKKWKEVMDITGMPHTTCQDYYGQGRAEKL